MNLEHKEWDMQKREQISLCLWCGIFMISGCVIFALYKFPLAVIPLMLPLVYLLRLEITNNRGMGNILRAEGKIQ